ncbi:MAG: tyrosine-protein phosphatase [Bacilli bacterium]|nr:tyrosine-protein phosphatase [Bacilli bacterium]
MARHYNFEGIENFRELGGFETPFGDTSYNVIYRSGTLSDATDNDLKKIKELGIRSVIDFRTPKTKEEFPDKTLHMEGIVTYQFNVNGGGRIATDFDDMVESYMEMFKDPQNSKEILECIAHCEKPLVIHCTAGKDRTGAYSMLLLWANGVSFDDISADYLLSFPYLPKLYQKAIEGDKKYPVCVLEPNSHFMPLVLKVFQERYKDPISYFRMIGLDESTIGLLCNILHKQEKSCGAVVKYKGKVLVEEMVHGHFSLPKGHVELCDRDEVDTARREIKEETGLDVEIDCSSSYYIYYSPFPGIAKKVVFFLAESSTDKVTNQPEEVKNILWLSPEDALNVLTYKSDKDVLEWAINKKVS